jgi:hypothetical protein
MIFLFLGYSLIEYRWIVFSLYPNGSLGEEYIPSSLVEEGRI